MNKIERTIEYVKNTLEGAEAGHDWFHIERVHRNALYLARKIPCDREVVELAALLHDIADPKFHDGDETLSISRSKKHMESIQVDEGVIERVLYIIQHMSFKNHMESEVKRNAELDIVQDADRLDAIGAIGIARTFNFGGFKNNPLYDPSIKPMVNYSKEEYKKSKGTTINHFYEKLLLLKDLMNTEEAKRIAEERHLFMEEFLAQFMKEWDGPKD